MPKHTDQMSVDQRLTRLEALIVRLFYVILMLVLAGFISWLVMFSIISSRDSRRTDVDAKFHDLACLALYDSDKTSQFHKDLEVLYPSCPEERAFRQRVEPSYSPPVSIPPTKINSRAPGNQQAGVSQPTPSSSPTPTAIRPQVRPGAPGATVSRTVTKTAESPTSETSTPSATVTTTQVVRPSNVLCSPVGLPVVIGNC